MNKTITITKVLTDIEIVGALVNFNGVKTVTYREIYNNGDTVVKNYELTAEEYAQWGNDDNYIKTLIETKY
jgi:hypothetical protein